LIIPGAGMAAAARKRSRAKTELNQVAAMIGNYKAKMNFYPPTAANCSPTNQPYSPLYYELVGTRFENKVFTTLDGSTRVRVSDLNTIFGIKGFVNATQGAGTPDEGVNAQNFTKATLKGTQVAEVSASGYTFTILGTSVEGPVMLSNATGQKINPIGYNSANPTNNPKAYDLWVDILIRGKTERIYSSLPQ